jgi:hypothetical protein
LCHSADRPKQCPDDLCYEVLIRRLDSNPFEIDHWQNSLAVDVYVSAIRDRLKDKSAFNLTSGDIGTAEGVANLELNNIVCLSPGGPFPFVLKEDKTTTSSRHACFIHEHMSTQEQAVYQEERAAESKEYADASLSNKQSPSVR